MRRTDAGRGRRPRWGVFVALAIGLASCRAEAPAILDGDGRSQGRWDVSIDFCSLVDCPDRGPATSSEIEAVVQAVAADDQVLVHAMFTAAEVNRQAAAVAGFADTELFGPRISLQVEHAQEVTERYSGLPGVAAAVRHDHAEAALADLHEDPVVGALRTWIGCVFCDFGVSPAWADLRLFLCDDQACPRITPDEQAAVAATLQDDPDVVIAEYESEEVAFRRFVERFADRPDVIEGVSATSLPASFVVQLQNDVDGRTVAGRYESLPGVEEVVTFDRPELTLEFIPQLRAATVMLAPDR